MFDSQQNPDYFSEIPSDVMPLIFSYFNLQELATIVSVRKDWNQFIEKAIKGEILKEIHAFKAKIKPIQEKINKEKAEQGFSSYEDSEQIAELWRNYVLGAMNVGYLPLIWKIANDSAAEVGVEFYSEFKSACIKLAEKVHSLKSIRKNILFVRADLSNSTELSLLNLSEFSFRCANLSNAVLTRIKLDNADLTDANLTNAILYETSLVNAKFSLQQLLSAKSILLIKIDKETLIKNNFSEEDIKKLQEKYMMEGKQIIENAKSIAQLIEITNYFKSDSFSYKDTNLDSFMKGTNFNEDQILSIARKVLKFLSVLTIDERSKALKNFKIKELFETAGKIYFERIILPYRDEGGWFKNGTLEKVYLEAQKNDELTLLFSSRQYRNVFFEWLGVLNIRPINIMLLDNTSNWVGTLRPTEYQIAEGVIFNLTGYQLESANFTSNHIENCNFNSAILRDANFKSAKLINVTFDSSDLKNSNFRNSTLKNVNFRNADLSQADFANGYNLSSVTRSSETIFLENVDFSYAILTGAGFKGSFNAKNVNFSHTNLSQTIIGSSQLRNVSNLESTILDGLELQKLKLDNINVKNASFKNCDLTDSDFSAVENLEGVSFENANLKNANLSYCDLSKTILSHADLSGADLIGSIINKDNLLKASSIKDIEIDSDTLKKNNYTDSEIIALKQKLVNDYKKFFDTCTDFDVLCNKLNYLTEVEEHLLKVKRSGIFKYGDTEASAAVINYGRDRLVKLLDGYIANHNMLSGKERADLTQLKNNDFRVLAPVFNKNIYTVSLWLSEKSSDNSKEIFNAIKDKVALILGDNTKQNQNINLNSWVATRYIPK
jgi:uncharacterized protein YjbI with pentapeptide repeats